MAARKTKQSDTGPARPAAKAAPKPAHVSSAKTDAAAGQPKQLRPLHHLLIAAGIGIVTWLCLKTCLDNGISLWDDTPYIRDDVFIKDVSWQGIKHIFSNPVMGNYHPLTILSYAMEYSMAQLEPWLYHFDSLLMHVAVTLLVYWFVLLLSRRTAAAVVTALLFGLHPMHMESVAWVSGRKDLLCGVFYMAACIAWVLYLRGQGVKRNGWYIGVIALFVCALLSKGVAVTLPLTLLLLDYFEKRPLVKKVLLEKIPFFILALAFGILSVKVQHAAGAMDMEKTHYNPIERMALGGYALFTYLWKAVIPAGLHCIYPYPAKVNGVLPFTYYLYPLVCAALIFMVWKYCRRNRVIVFGTLFFLANISLLLQLIPVGQAIVAERYTYISYLGLFFMAGWWVSGFFGPGADSRYLYIAPGATMVYIAVLAYAAGERCAVWRDETSLWRDELAKEPDAPVAYTNLGYVYSGRWTTVTDPAEKKTDYDSAVYLLNRSIAMRPDFLNPYVALGEMQRSAGQYDQSKATFFRAIKVKPGESSLYLELAILYYVVKDNDSAGIFFRKEMELDPSSSSYGNYGNYLESVDKNDSALMEYNKSIAMTTTNYILYANRGKLYKKLKHWNEAEEDFDTAIKINPDIAELYYLRSQCDTQKGNRPLALQDVEKSISLGYKDVDNSYYQELKTPGYKKPVDTSYQGLKK